MKDLKFGWRNVNIKSVWWPDPNFTPKKKKKIGMNVEKDINQIWDGPNSDITMIFILATASFNLYHHSYFRGSVTKERRPLKQTKAAWIFHVSSKKNLPKNNDIFIYWAKPNYAIRVVHEYGAFPILLN